MDELKKIKYNRSINKLNNYLNSLLYSPNKYLGYDAYFDNERDMIYIDTSSNYEKVIKVDRRTPMFNMDEELFFDTIKKFTKYDDYKIRWMRLII